ncbi:PAC2 family protein [Candidatus Woesearchaeota archaeon]|nr:PAC2 family protein [Candidatus Woesearchaeota archaeon]
MSEWKVTVHKKVKLKNAVLIEGMPGIGNVGKIACDVIAEQVKAQRIASFFSHCLPNSVFVQEDHTVKLPTIELLYKKVKKRDFLFLVGDIQPAREEDSYSFTEAVLSLAKKLGCKEVAALGGIGLGEMPVESRIYCTGNDKKLVDGFAKYGADPQLYGIVGPIMGVTGLVLGLGDAYGIKAVALLAETYASPMHVGLHEAKGLMRILEKKYSFGVKIAEFEKDLKKLEKELKPRARQQEMLDQEAETHYQDTSYIG